MNTLKYVFENRQPELQKMVVKYGLRPAKNKLDLFKKVNAIVAKYKADALKDIAEIHPDRELILWSVGYGTPATPPPVSENKSSAAGCGCSAASGEYSNCGGCGCGCGCGANAVNKSTPMKFSNAEGDGANKDANMPLIIIGSLIAVGVLMFAGGRQ